MRDSTAGKPVVSASSNWHVILIADNKDEAEAIKERVKEKLSQMGLSLSEEKTKVTHWSQRWLWLSKEFGKGVTEVLGEQRFHIRFDSS